MNRWSVITTLASMPHQRPSTVPKSESGKLQTIWQITLQVWYFYLEKVAMHGILWMSIVIFWPGKPAEMWYRLTSLCLLGQFYIIHICSMLWTYHSGFLRNLKIFPSTFLYQPSNFDDLQLYREVQPMAKHVLWLPPIVYWNKQHNSCNICRCVYTYI